MRADGVSFRHAVELLRADHLPLTAASSPVKKSTVPKLPPPVAREADDRLLLTQVVGYYTETLKQSPEAMKYLASRGLTSPELIDRFRLGFANRTLGLRLPAKNRAAGAEMRGRLQALGVLRESGHEHFNGSVVVPVFDSTGAVVEMYGRKITANLREGTPDHLYLKGEHRGVWNEEALIASKDVILCEALIDALTFWAAGFRNVTASYGVNGFTKDHRAAFERHGTERVYLAYDRDEAGDTAAAKLAGELTGLGIECFRVEFPKGMDANAYALKVTPATKSLGVLLSRASWLGKGQRPELRGAGPEIAATVKEERAAKEKMIEDAEPRPAAAADGPTENVLPLAAVLEPSAPMPFAAPADVAVEVRGEDVLMRFGDREYRVRGLQKNTSGELLRINLRVMSVNAHGDVALHVDTLELNAARPRMAFVKQAAAELGIKEEILRRDVGKVLFKLEELRDEQIRLALLPKEEAVALTEEERAAAMEMLRDPRLLDRIVEDFARCGVVGEETNKLVGYLGVVSRHGQAGCLGPEGHRVVGRALRAAARTRLRPAAQAGPPGRGARRAEEGGGPAAAAHRGAGAGPREERAQSSASAKCLCSMRRSPGELPAMSLLDEAGVREQSYSDEALEAMSRLGGNQAARFRYRS